MPVTYIAPQRNRVVTALYSPPLSRNDFEELRDVAELADCDVEVSEVVFKGSGKRVLLVRLPAPGGYFTVEPDEYLAYYSQLRQLHAITSEHLKSYVKEDDNDG